MRELFWTLIAIWMWFSGPVHAEVVVDQGDSKYIFKIDGKPVSPAQAAKSAESNEIERCSPIKGALSADGKDAVAYKCKIVVLSYSARTGIPHWKVK